MEFRLSWTVEIYARFGRNCVLALGNVGCAWAPDWELANGGFYRIHDGDVMDAGKVISLNMVHGVYYDEVAYNRLGLVVV